MRVGSLFSGIGGLDLGLERAGMTVVWQSEIDPYCSEVLAKHWPHVPNLGDVAQIGWSTVERPDLICGGFPCQPVSLAGAQRGQDDERWLWPEFARCVRALRPRYVLVENVPGLLIRGMGDVLGDLAACGYDCEWDCIPAAAVGAPHLRYRVFIVAHSCGAGLERGRLRRAASQRGANVAYADSGGFEVCGEPQSRGEQGASRSVFDGRSSLRQLEHVAATRRWAVEPDVGRVAHGIPRRVDRLRGLGNAVVPQVAEWIGRRLLVGEEER